MRSTPISLLALALLAACMTDRSVEGRTMTGAETFTGSASDGWGSGGALTITSDKGTKCSGRLVEAQSIGSTMVVLTCDDGRAGSVLLLSSGGADVGTGVLGNDAITLTIAH